MYQIQATCGYEIHVIGCGENGLCRIVNSDGVDKHSGTYAECVAWLHARSIRLLEDTAK